jgi:rhodanese-related sulfurtransferase
VRAQTRSVPAPDAYADIQHGQTVFIDTRSAAEKSAGSPAGVTAEITYPMDSSQDERFIADVLKATGGRRDVSVTLICTSGVRSAQAQAVLERNGFTRARSIDGGFGGWQRSGLPHSTAK